MSVENDFASFSLRIPAKLRDQIDGLRQISRRSRNAEIELLIEEALDARVAQDRKIMEALKNLGQNNPSKS